ncbi:MAG: hypothetical protein WCY77_08530 [Weeksellaceae bacterium]
MKTRFLILANFILLSFSWAQSANHSQSIQGNFSSQNILAYQENSVSLVQNFYDYLTLYSNETDSELKLQIQENIRSIVHSSQFEIPDFTRNVQSTISLNEFLRKIENQKYQFQVENMKTPQSIQFDYWVNQYDLKIQGGNEVSTQRLEQVIQFRPIEKQFGSRSKTVWELKLSSIKN